MQLTPVDQDNNLFLITSIVSKDLQQKILSTNWLDLDFVRQYGQEDWLRRTIINSQLDWYQQWQQEIQDNWAQLAQDLLLQLHPYTDTAFWVDEPGFICDIHTDGELPGSLHLSWIGNSSLGTTFYYDRNNNRVRFQHNFQPNSGYVMINQLDTSGYRRLQWHGMLEPVPAGTYRLTSYTWLNPVK